MVHILASDLREKLLIIEGKGFEYDLDRDSDYCIKGCIREYQERCLIPIVFEDEYDLLDWDRYLDSIVIGPIYGLGGWNRYPIYGTGEVKISERLSHKRSVDKAMTLGFTVHH